MTLREAQRMCAENFNDINNTLDQSRKQTWTPFVMATDLLEEAGEVASVVKGLEGFKPPEKRKTREMLASELSDLLYIVFVLADHYGVELDETFLRTVDGYRARYIKK